MRRKIFSLFATLTTIVAIAVASSACFFSAYQPKEPKCLQEK